VIDFMIGQSRPGGVRGTPEGEIVPRPFDIKYIPRAVLGRRLGGSFAYGNTDSMEWSYAVGIDTLYTTIRGRYDPKNPWVWVHILDVYTGEGRWYEAVMHEPRVTRTAGNTIASLLVLFTKMRDP
jgi:hypothetical protein